jgi:hypothetical protein
MTVRPPRASTRTSRVDALDYEIVQEQVSAFGRQGRALEAALAALAEHDRSGAQHHAQAAAARAPRREPPSRGKLIQDASDALWCFIVQRECCGLRDPRPVFRDYRVPAEVQNRMGAFDNGRLPIGRHGRR